MYRPVHLQPASQEGGNAAKAAKGITPGNRAPVGQPYRPPTTSGSGPVAGSFVWLANSLASWQKPIRSNQRFLRICPAARLPLRHFAPGCIGRLAVCALPPSFCQVAALLTCRPASSPV